MNVLASAQNDGRPPRTRRARIAAIALLAAAAAGSLAVPPMLPSLGLGGGARVAAQQFRPAPRFEGKAIPDPPAQGQPWAPPATTLPRFLVAAAGFLFDQGVADPRGCDYRQVEIARHAPTKARGFVLPERADTPGRFVIGWDGLVYPALVVGEPADLVGDMKGIADAMKRSREAQKSDPTRRRFAWDSSWGFPRSPQDPFDASGFDDNSPLKLCLLLRLGRADLAETLFAAATPWTPGPRGRDLTDYGISYLSLAYNWAGFAFSRLIEAHVRGDEVIALDAARRLSRFRDLAAARADAMGFARPEQQRSNEAGVRPHFAYLNQLDDLLRDQERRAKLSPRAPIPPKGGDPKVRIAALIRDLDQIDEPQMSSPRSAQPGSSPLVKELIAEGDPAVEPLLAVLESDDRLTRSVSQGRGLSTERFVHPVDEAAFPALIGILKTNEFNDRRTYGWTKPDPAARKALAASIRQFWEKTRSIPLLDRWYEALRDDSAGPARWLEAAGGIVSPDIPEGTPFPRPVSTPMKGASLRAGKDPSVATLMIRRATDIQRAPGLITPGTGLAGACQMGSLLTAWDEAASLPLLKALCAECLKLSDANRAQKSSQQFDQSLTTYLAAFTEARSRIGDPGALDEYADWLRTTSPTMLGYATLAAFKPLLAHPDHPALSSAARWLFNDPKSPWVPILPEARGEMASKIQSLFKSPMISVAGFREGVLAGLKDRAPLGTVQKTGDQSIQCKSAGAPITNMGSSDFDLEGVPLNVEFPYRRCDLLASHLSALEGSPRCELLWPEARRDDAVAGCTAFLERFGTSFTDEPSPSPHFHFGSAHLKFPPLDAPATPADVASGRAIFSLDGQGEARRVNLPAYPQLARWITLKDSPVILTDGNNVRRREYDTDGLVWQAEEVRRGGAWERYYGFVGHHTIARVPASEIEFGSRYFPGGQLKGGLTARAEAVEKPGPGFAPGQPILVALHLQNRLGVPRPGPTDLLRPAPDGKPSLRKGLTLVLRRSNSRALDLNRPRDEPEDVIEPRRDAHFDPGPAARPLEPLESFEAFRLDLRDWFDLSRPGTFRLRITSDADSGLGEGIASEAYFQVGGTD